MKRRPSESTLNPILKGSVVDSKHVEKVLPAPKARATRDVRFSDGTQKRMSVPVLQDFLLIRKGYEPKYSSKPLEWFHKRLKPK